MNAIDLIPDEIKQIDAFQTVDLLFALLGATDEQEMICHLTHQMMYLVKRKMPPDAPWTDVHRYSDPSNIVKGETGRYKNVRFVLVHRDSPVQFSITVVKKGLENDRSSR